MSARASAGRWLAVAASVVVVATIVAAIAVMGTPAMQREARLDQRRASDLSRIARAVNAHALQHGALPSDLRALDGKHARLRLTDPKDGSHYGYETTGQQTYRLCAVFATDSAQTLEYTHAGGTDWSHGIGRQCFDLNTKRKD